MLNSLSLNEEKKEKSLIREWNNRKKNYYKNNKRKETPEEEKNKASITFWTNPSKRVPFKFTDTDKRTHAHKKMIANSFQ